MWCETEGGLLIPVNAGRIVVPVDDDSIEPPPTSLTLLAMWRADRLVTLSGTSVTAVGDTGPSGDSNRNLSQATPGAQPTIIPNDSRFLNKPSFQFDGGDFLPCVGNWSGAISQPFTVCFVVNLNTITAQVATDGTPHGTSGGLVFVGAGGGWTSYAGTQISTGLSEAANAGQTKCVIAVFDGASSKLYHAGPTTTTSSGTTGTAGFQSFGIGNRPALDLGLNGSATPIFAIYQGSMGTADRTAWYLYSLNQFGAVYV
jgi:hypothetical protein